MIREITRNLRGQLPNVANRAIKFIWLDPMSFIFFTIFLILTFLFYTTDFRIQLENFFYDVRTNLMPSYGRSDLVSIIAIDDKSIETLETDKLRLRTDSNKKPYLSIKHLTSAVGTLANTEAAVIVLLMPDHAFPPEDPDIIELREMVKYDPRIIIGTIGYHQPIPNLRELPVAYREISEQIAAADTFRSRSNAIVRSMPILSYHGLNQTINLPPKVASMIKSDVAVNSGRYLIKFNDPNHYSVTKIEQYLANPNEKINQFKNKIIVVGYSSLRTPGIQTTEQSFVNTPLTGYAPTNLNGLSSTFLIANAIENLANGEDLTPPPAWITFIQTILVAGICGLSWSFSGLFALVVIGCTWLTLILVHAALYRWASLSIPLADTFLVSVLISLISASRRLRVDLKLLADQQVRTEIKSELSRFQSSFLTGFASWVSATTDTITNLVRAAKQDRSLGTTSVALYDKIFLAASDLNEYLSGISQLSQAENLQSFNVKLEFIDVRGLLNSVTRRFDEKARTKEISFQIDVQENLKTISTNPQFIDAILFNLVSNAVKYGHPKSTVEIRSFTANEEVIFSVTDEGPGIPLELQERVFERFYRINDERIYNAKGTGVGLYLCKFFAESLGGRIELKSASGRGCEFKAILPRRD